MLQKLKRLFHRNINAKEITYTTAKKILKKENGILLDIRGEQEYKEQHLPGAIGIELYSLKQNIEKIIPNKNTVIVVYCNSGGRSKQAQEILENLEYKDVYNLKGGLNNL